jgi:hypothetical protein
MSGDALHNFIANNLTCITNGGGTAIAGGNTGSTINNLSRSNNRSGTLLDNASITSEIGGIINFDGDKDAIDFGSNIPNFPNSDISVFLWINATTLRNGWNIYFTKWFSDNSGAGGVSDFHYAIYPNGGQYFQNLYTTNTSNMFGSTPISTSRWYQVGFTLSNGLSYNEEIGIIYKTNEYKTTGNIAHATLGLIDQVLTYNTGGIDLVYGVKQTGYIPLYGLSPLTGFIGITGSTLTPLTTQVSIEGSADYSFNFISGIMEEYRHNYLYYLSTRL